MLAGVSGQAAPAPRRPAEPSRSAPLPCVAAHSSHCVRTDASARLAEDGHLRANGAPLCKYGGPRRPAGLRPGAPSTGGAGWEFA